MLQKRGLEIGERVFFVFPRARLASKLIVVHTGVVPVPPIRATGNHGLAPQPSATSIAVAAIVARPPSQTYSDEAVIEAMVVMGEVIVIVVVAVPVLAMPIVAMPIIIAMPCRAAMPATTAPSANTGDVSATYSASVDVADVSSAYMDAAHVADVSCLHGCCPCGRHPCAHRRNVLRRPCGRHPYGLRHSLNSIKTGTSSRLPARAATAVIFFFMTTSPWVRKGVFPSADFVASLTLKRGGSLRWIKPVVCNHWSAQIPHRRLLSRLTEVWGQGWPSTATVLTC